MREYYVGADGTVTFKDVEVLIMLTGVTADRVALTKIMRCMPHNSYLGCPFCDLNGTRCGNAMRFLGYLSPVECGPRRSGPADPLNMEPRPTRLAGDPASTLTHEVHMARGAAAELDGRAAATPAAAAAEAMRHKTLGCRGVCPIISDLPYLRYDRTFMLPVYHGMLYGVVKAFFKAVLPKKEPAAADAWAFSARARKIIKVRAHNLHLPFEFKHGYKCIIEHKSSYKLEDCTLWRRTPCSVASMSIAWTPLTEICRARPLRPPPRPRRPRRPPRRTPTCSSMPKWLRATTSTCVPTTCMLS